MRSWRGWFCLHGHPATEETGVVLPTIAAPDAAAQHAEPACEAVEAQHGTGEASYAAGPTQHARPEESTSGSIALPEAQSEAMPLRLNIPFSDLSFHELIGKGTFKAVYRGRWHSANVAIVSMRRGGIVKEARIQQLIGNHPNVVQFYRWTVDDSGNEFMVMEYVQMGSMDKLLLSRGKSLRTRQRLAMSEQICSGMCELASAGVLHRDLAGRNILVSSLEPVHVKVSDFGLAWIQPDGSSATPDKLPSIPVRWSPPEVLTDAQWSEKSDVWSFGVTMWEIFSSGREPYANSSDAEVLEAVARFDLLPRPKRCPKEVYDLMLRCWHKDPAVRPTFAEILQVFKGWQASYRPKMHLQASAKYLAETKKKRVARQAAWDRPMRYVPGPVKPIAAPKPPPQTPEAQLADAIILKDSLDVVTLEDSDAAPRASRPKQWASSQEALPKADLIHIMTNVSLSDDGSSCSNHSRSINLSAVEQLKEQHTGTSTFQPRSSSPREGQDQPRRKKDISLDYLIQLRAPASTVIVEPAPTSLTHVGVGPEPYLRRELPPSSAAGLGTTSQVPEVPSRVGMLQQSTSGRQSRVSSSALSRGPSGNSLGHHLTTGDQVSESHLSFEFEPPIDPMISLTTSFSMGQHSLRSDSVHMSEFDRSGEEPSSNRLHWLGNDSGQQDEVMLMLSSKDQAADPGHRDGSWSQRKANDSHSRPAAFSRPITATVTPASGNRHGRGAAASAVASDSGECSGVPLSTPRLQLPQQLAPNSSSHVGHTCTRPVLSPLGVRGNTSPYVDLQLLVRAQASEATRG